MALWVQWGLWPIATLVVLASSGAGHFTWAAPFTPEANPCFGRLARLAGAGLAALDLPYYPRCALPPCVVRTTDYNTDKRQFTASSKRRCGL